MMAIVTPHYYLNASTIFMLFKSFREMITWLNLIMNIFMFSYILKLNIEIDMQFY